MRNMWRGGLSSLITCPVIFHVVLRKAFDGRLATKEQRLGFGAEA